MEDLFRRLAELMALAVEAAAILIVAVGAVEAFAGVLGAIAERASDQG